MLLLFVRFASLNTVYLGLAVQKLPGLQDSCCLLFVIARLLFVIGHLRDNKFAQVPYK